MRERGPLWYFTPLLVAIAAWALLLGGGVVCTRMRRAGPVEQPAGAHSP